MSCVTHADSSDDDSDSASSVGLSFLFGGYSSGDELDDAMAANYASINIQTHLPLKLELRSPNYTKWSTFFESLCGKFGLLAHIDGTPPPDPLTDEWTKADFCVRNWLYGSVADAVLDFAMAPNQTAHALWAAIAAHFQANQAPRAIFLSHAFHSMTQGDRSVEDYGNEMKKAVDALHDVGKPVAESTLLFNLLCGVNPKFSTTADMIVATTGMTFTTALDQLKLKELRLENEAKVKVTTAPLPASSSSSGCSGADCRSSKLQQQPQQLQQGASSSTGGQRRKKFNGRRNNSVGQQPRAPSLLARGFASIRRHFRGAGLWRRQQRAVPPWS